MSASSAGSLFGNCGSRSCCGSVSTGSFVWVFWGFDVAIPGGRIGRLEIVSKAYGLFSGELRWSGSGM